MQSAKEAASNVAASAKSGMDKTKATVQEKVEKMTSHNPTEKDMAAHRKQEKIDQAELNKQAAHDHNAAARQQHSATTGHTTTTGIHPTHGTGTGTTTGHTTTPTMGGGYNQGTGGGYTH